MKDFTVKQLRYAIALADFGHFGRASAHAHISQPALSQQIKLLEDGCQTALFERVSTGIRPTAFGLTFIQRARHIVQETDALLAFAQDHSDRPAHPISFGLIPTVAPYLLPDIFPAIKRDLPDINFIISESRTEALLEQLARGTLDMALIATDLPANSKLFEAPLFADPFVLATSPAFPISAPVALSSIPQDQILLLDEGHCFRDQAIEACALRGPAATWAFAATSLSTIVEFVANGQGVTLLPAISLKKETSDHRVKTHRLQSPGASRNLRLIWRNNAPFKKVFSQVAATIIKSGQTSLSSPVAKSVLADQPG